jgi:putative peptidoglycan lipid II flippase
VGLLAATIGRLYASALYALGDTRTPLRFAVLRLQLTAGLGWFGALILPEWLGLPKAWGAAGLTASAGLAAWVEFMLLRRSLQGRVGELPRQPREMAKLWLVAGLAAAVAWGVRLSIRGVALHPAIEGGLVIVPYCLVYLWAVWRIGVGPARELAAGVTRRLRRQ